MNKEKIVVLIDTCCDVPQAFAEQYHMYVIPPKAVHKDMEYFGGADTTPKQVYQDLERGVPGTSLPNGERITGIPDQIQTDGLQKVIAVTLFSGLSGTSNMTRLIADQLEDAEVFTMDTKNISIGGGFHAIQAAHYIEDGLSSDEIKAKLMRGTNQCKVFFVVKTLEYLQKGGRIGLATSLLGNALDLKPIISCNDGGVHYTVVKVRGGKQLITGTKELTLDFMQGHKRYNIATMHGNVQEMVEEIRDCIMKKLPGTDAFTMKQVSPVPGAHIGPDTLGIYVQILDGT